MPQPAVTTYPILRRGAEDGVPFGLYLSALIICMLQGIDTPFLSFVCLIFIIGTPIFAFRLMLRTARKAEPALSWPALWTYGIATFAFGSLIMALASYTYLTYFAPDYFIHLGQQAAELYSAIDAPMPEGFSPDIIQKATALISPIQFSVQMIWTATFLGSILCLVYSVIISQYARK